ncbi:hypothetical protein OHS58_48550 [Amycolatopsis sp. NBC_00348]|uniref:hypothetical protein n=1 Tax=unclassified Amycolatopsis TaxID=2618356 RepID=UPI002E266967|nr:MULTISPECIES: hypothetical protein [unclassified Amycolatopsis]
MTDRLFVPAPLSGLLATMPPATATPWDRWEWLDQTHCSLKQLFNGPHGLQAMRMDRAILAARNATHDEIENSTTTSAA